jgi:hypothetical protein
MRMRLDNASSRGAPISARQRHAMHNVALHRNDERVVVLAVIELDRDGVPAVQLSGADTVCAIDYLHRAALHEDGRELGARLRQAMYVLLVLAI